MKTTFEERRLNAIKLRFFFAPVECACCRSEVKLENVWTVWRYGLNKTKHRWYYCRNCMPTAEAVLNEIDTDEIQFGIADVDDYRNFKKKDDTRMNNAFVEFPPP